MALPFLHYVIGNGESTSLWFDPWIHNAHIACHPSDQIIGLSRLDCNALVADIINDFAWQLPSSNHHFIMELRSKIVNSLIMPSSLEHQILWNGTQVSLIKVAQIWDSIRPRCLMVAWHAIVWFPQCVPRFSFVLWLAFKGKMHTKDIMAKYTPHLNPSCLLCTTGDECFGHLFFECSYSYEILFMVFRRCGWRGNSRSWMAIATFIMSSRGSHKVVLSLALSATVYYVWLERNQRIHGHAPSPARVVAKNILHVLRCRISSLTLARKCDLYVEPL